MKALKTFKKTTFKSVLQNDRVASTTNQLHEMSLNGLIFTYLADISFSTIIYHEVYLNMLDV